MFGALRSKQTWEANLSREEREAGLPHSKMANEAR